MFLERVAEMFEIVVFTASQSIYAKQLLDILDPDRKHLSLIELIVNHAFFQMEVTPRT